MNTTDVNEQFAAQRRAQMDSAGARRNDSGQWIGTAGWDANEVIGRDGLDTTTGQAALYTTVPAWHGLGEVVPEGTTDIDTVLELGRIGWNVELVPSTYTWHGETRKHPDRFATVRDDTGDALGSVGKIYQQIQNRESFEFLQDLVEEYGVTWESAGALRGGRRTFVSMRLPESVTVDAGGVSDEIIPFVVAMNSHDGSTPFQVVVTPWRPVCSNTERLAVKDAHTRWTVRHTRTYNQRMTEARRTLGLSLAYYEQFAAEQTQLAQTEIALAEFESLIADVWPTEPQPSKRAATMDANRRHALDSLFSVESKRVGRTAYAAERAVTDYLDHFAPVRPGATMTEEIARATRLMEGTDDDKKTHAHKRLMLLRR